MIIIVVFAVVALLYGSANAYIGRRLWQWLQVLAPLPIPRSRYWAGFWLLAGLPLLVPLLAGRIPMAVTKLLSQFGGYWVALLIYAVLLLGVVDLIRLLARMTGIAAAGNLASRPVIAATGATIAALLIVVLAYGTWRARTPVVTDYAITLPKPAGPHRDLTVVLVADTHLGYINGTGRIDGLVSMVNALQPDLILIAGDLMNDDLRPFLADGMAAELGRLQARFGTYVVAGNHDAPAAEMAVFRAELERAGIRLLVDEWVTVDNSLVLVGRNDTGGPRASGDIVAAPLPNLLQDVNRSLPLIVIDHNPIRFADAVAVGADLQVSGHTHAGQIFPFNLITGLTYEQQWGTLQKADSHLVVTSGFGTWGPPIRVGTRPEVARIALTFAAPAGR